MIPHRWHGQIRVDGKLLKIGGVDPMYKNAYGPNAAYRFDDILRHIKHKLDAEFGSNWSAANIFDPYAWNASPASDYGMGR